MACIIVKLLQYLVPGFGAAGVAYYGRATFEGN